ncbi:hypothetical protein MGSAQ_001177, partial [marine sediment metagenome]
DTHPTLTKYSFGQTLTLLSQSTASDRHSPYSHKVQFQTGTRPTLTKYSFRQALALLV